MLQAALPPRPKLPPAVELENVAPALLLPPAQRGTAAVALAGGRGAGHGVDTSANLQCLTKGPGPRLAPVGPGLPLLQNIVLCV